MWKNRGGGEKIDEKNFRPERGFEPMTSAIPIPLALAQLVEHCTGIAEVMGSNPVQA